MLNELDSTLFNQICFGNSDRAAYSDLNPLDGGQSLYPMSTVVDWEGGGKEIEDSDQIDGAA